MGFGQSYQMVKISAIDDGEVCLIGDFQLA
jgi:hypothetical protein